MINNYLSHHGIKGQRWGIRRYQNEDGSLTAAGKKRSTKNKVGIGIRSSVIGLLTTGTMAGIYSASVKQTKPLAFARGEAALAAILAASGGIAAATIVSNFEKKRRYMDSL